MNRYVIQEMNMEQRHIHPFVCQMDFGHHGQIVSVVAVH